MNKKYGALNFIPSSFYVKQRKQLVVKYRKQSSTNIKFPQLVNVLKKQCDLEALNESEINESINERSYK